MSKKILTPTVTRRELVLSAAAVLSLFAIGAAAKAEKAPALIRPPKVTDEEDFLARCIKCDAVFQSVRLMLFPLRNGLTDCVIFGLP
jgi:hypothetical protein